VGRPYSPAVGEAFFWGALGAGALVVGAAFALAVPIPRHVLGLIMAVGSGVLISAVAFDLVEEAVDTAHGVGGVAVGLAAGALTFFVGDTVIDRMGGDKRKSSSGEQAEGSGLAIVLGAVLDGIPESIVLGIGLLAGAGVSVAFIVAVFVSNLPEGIAATTGLKASGWAPQRVIGLWLLVALVSALASLAGFAVFDSASNWTIAFVLAFAGGAVLTMLADTMMPEAFEHGGRQVGLMTTAGFAIAFALHLIE
jgi:zinc transporter, ZIP family